MTQSRTGPDPSKKSLRESALRARRALDTKQVKSLSERVHQNLMGLREFSGARVLECYVAMKEEVQTEEIIRHSLERGVKVLVPVVDAARKGLLFSGLRDYSELAEGHFGILEPKSAFLRPTPLGEAEAILVPLVAWDDRGFRIGYGKGYFDRALASVSPKVPTIGLGFELQRVEMIPTKPHDVPLKFMVTEKRAIRFRDGNESSNARSTPAESARRKAHLLRGAMLLNGSTRTVMGCGG